jgi:hypothetical protein
MQVPGRSVRADVSQDQGGAERVKVWKESGCGSAASSGKRW